MEKSPEKDLYCGFGYLMNDVEKDILNKLTLDVFENTPISQRPRPIELVNLAVWRNLNPIG